MKKNILKKNKAAESLTPASLSAKANERASGNFIKKDAKKKIRKTVELLAPAGSLNKMKYALHYGADAVYAGVPDFSLRARINEFDFEGLNEGVEYAHKLGKKFYVTLNIYAHNIHLKKLEAHLKKLNNIDIDGIILSDPGVLLLVKKHLPQVEIHLSTQANATNWQAVKFWQQQGVSRVVLAREVTLAEIREIKKNVPKMELEYFVHGAMCMSYSGRCILSKWMSNKSANLGDCSQPCRWKYLEKKKEVKKLTVVDHQGEFEMDVEEDRQGTYFFNSKDLNLLNYLKEMSDAGVDSFKIEGRNKSGYYLATVIRAYRKVLDAVIEKNKKIKSIAKQESENLNNLVNRGYTTGFLLDTEPEHNFMNSHNESQFEFVGEINEKIPNSKFQIPNKNKGLDLFEVKVHNAIYANDSVEVVSNTGNAKIKILQMFNEKMEEVDSAHGGQKSIYYLRFNKKNIEGMTFLRKKVI